MFEGRALACHRGGRMVFAELGFALEAGDALLLRGPNGSGKSTLLRLLSLMTPRCGGELLWQGSSVDDDRDAHRSRLRFLGHSDGLKPALSVLENLMFAARLVDPATDSERCLVALEQLGLQALAAQPVRFLSAGQKRRLALSRLAASPGELWLLDEPGTGLDAESMLRLERLIAAHRALGGIVVLSSHGDLEPNNARRIDLDAFAARSAA